MDTGEGSLARLQLWLERPTTGDGWQERLRMVARIAWGVVRDISQGSISQYAASLSYTTLLSVVPILALSFSVLKGLGAENTLIPMLTQLLKPLGDAGQPITDFILQFVDRVEAGVLGAVGLGVLAYTAVSVVQKIEGAFNEIWQIREQRTWGRKFTDYLSVLMVGPLLAVAAIGLIRRLQEQAAGEQLSAYEPLQEGLQGLLGLAPFALLLLAFAGLYGFLPNTKVKVLPALGGALFASLTWLAAGWAFATFVAASSKYTAIYSAFASLVLFLIWLNVNWMIVLMGADVAFYLQNPHRLKSASPEALSPAAKERLGMEVVAEIVHRQYAGAPPPSLLELAQTLRRPSGTLKAVLATFETAGLIARSDGKPHRYVLLRPPESTGVGAVLAAVRGDDGAAPSPIGPIDAVAAAVTGAVAAGTASWTLKSLAGAGNPPRDVSRWIDDALI